MNFEYANPTRVLFGQGVVEAIPEIIEIVSAGSILLVTGRNAMRQLGHTERMVHHLGQKRVVLFEEVEPNPTADTVERGLDLCRREECTVVIGLGGGSPLDVAKAIAALSNNPGRVIEYTRQEREPNRLGVPYIAVPTTSGSGSEVTPYSIITVPEERSKFSIRNPVLYPRIAVVDPMLTVSLPPRQTAATGLDVLCHALESIWSTRGQPIAQEWAESAVDLVFRHLISAFRDGNNLEAREGMSLASLLAGLAISQTGTTAIHQASYPLTFDFHLEHGFACALFLPSFLRYNRTVVAHRFDRLIQVLGCGDWNGLETMVLELMVALDAPMHLSELDVDEEQEMISDIAERGIGKSSLFNPAGFEKKNLESILRGLGECSHRTPGKPGS